MKLVLILITTLATTFSAFAADENTVQCSTTINGVKQTVTLRLNAQGKIVNWSEKQIAKASKNSIFSPLADNLDESVFEYVHFIKAPNGFSLIQAGSTMDEITVGVSKDRTVGFYAYRDLGAGTGNRRLTLTCSGF